MKVIVAEALGLCFGVRDALEQVAAVADPENVTVYGELVHNDAVNRRLDERGFRRMPERGREHAVPETPAVLVTAHGISHAERARLEAAGKRLVDTTCPLVRRAHEAALELDAEGCFVLVIGRRGHVEVQGLTGDLRRWEVVESLEEVRCYEADRIGVICQTTTPEPLVQAVLEAVRARNPGKVICFADTVCRPTRERQEALGLLLPDVDALVVVGGRNSRNTRELAEAACARGLPTLHVANAADLDPAWFNGYRTVGLTAGTSTLDETIAEVHRALLAMNNGERAALRMNDQKTTQRPEDTKTTKKCLGEL